MTRVLYAQPKKEAPVLDPKDLKQGVYRPLYDYVDVSFNIDYPYFTDIGHTIWEAANILDEKSSIELLRGGLLWRILITTSNMKVLLETIKYKGVFTVADDVTIYIRIDGDDEDAAELIRGVVAFMGHTPSEMSDWREFTRYTGVTREDAVNRWNQLLEMKPARVQEYDMKFELEHATHMFEELQNRAKQLKKKDPNIYLEDVQVPTYVTTKYIKKAIEDIKMLIDEKEALLGRRNGLQAELRDIMNRLGIDKIPAHLTSGGRTSRSTGDDLALRIAEILEEVDEIEQTLYKKS